MYIVLGIIYYCLGVSGFIYWWTSEHDLGVSESIMAVLAGVMGPLSWIIGYGIHGKNKTILINKRK